MKYRAEVDGLRAFAVLPVILFHAKIAGFDGGFVGVDIFFVISGYLITRILADEMAEGRYSLLRFYERRARRILPALTAMVLVTTVAAWWILPPIEMVWYGQSVAAAALFVANFYFLVRGRDYFAGTTSEYPLLHTWSLAVEEQFYIFFPLLLWALWRWRQSAILWVIVGLSAGSLAVAEVLSRIDVGLNFYLLPSRAWELGAGAICAMLHHRHGLKPNQWLAGLGLVLIITSIVLLNDGLRFPSVWAVPPVLGTALILLYAGQSTVTGKFLALKPFVWIGLISYSAYLWHQPLFALTHVKLGQYPGTWAMLGLAGASLVLGWVSWKYVEAPFRRRSGPGFLTSAGRVVGSAGGIIAGLSAIGVALHMSWGAPGRPAAPHLPRDYYEGAAKPNFPTFDRQFQSCTAFCTLVTQDAPTLRVLLLGDSHGQDLIPALRVEAQARDWQLDLFINTGCSYTGLDGARPDCIEADAALAAADFSQYDEVLLINRFSGLIERVGVGSQANALDDYADLARRVADSGAHLSLFSPRPTVNAYPTRAGLLQIRDQVQVTWDYGGSDDWARFATTLARHPRIDIVAQRQFVLDRGCGDPSCFDAHDSTGRLIYRDVSHYGPPSAAALLSHWIDMHLTPRRAASAG